MKHTIAGLSLLALSVGAAEAESLFSTPLIESVELEAILGHEDLAIIDVRNRIDGGSEEAFIEGHIPGAVYSNYLEAGWRAEQDGVVGLVNETKALETLIGSLGIDNDDSVVIVHGGVNATDFGSAARIYWTFNYLGHDNVSILNGGYQDWIRDAARPIETGLNQAKPASFQANVQSELLVSTADVEQTLQDEGYVRIDARPYTQHVGQSKAPMAKREGRIPDSIGLENALFIDPETGRVRPESELRERAPAALAASGETIISYCNTGHWASVNWFVFSELLGYEDVVLYDASMAGWSLDPNREMTVGEQLLHELSRWTTKG